jgi:hypothetical protein
VMPTSAVTFSSSFSSFFSTWIRLLSSNRKHKLITYFDIIYFCNFLNFEDRCRVLEVPHWRLMSLGMLQHVGWSVLIDIQKIVRGSKEWVSMILLNVYLLTNLCSVKSQRPWIFTITAFNLKSCRCHLMW